MEGSGNSAKTATLVVIAALVGTATVLQTGAAVLAMVWVFGTRAIPVTSNILWRLVVGGPLPWIAAVVAGVGAAAAATAALPRAEAAGVLARARAR